MDYGVVFQVMNLYDVTDPRQTLTDVRIMEGKAMEILNARARREASR